MCLCVCVSRKFVCGCFVLQVLRFEGEGNDHKREGRNISVILEFIYILIHAMDVVTTRQGPRAIFNSC